MAIKLSDLEHEDKSQLQNELDGKSAALGMESYESYGNALRTGLKDLIGICHDCKFLLYCKTEFGNVFAKCSELEIRLSGQNRIKECNLHAQRFAMSLNDMYSIAYLIDVDTNKKVQGFIGNKGG
jgi:hypothetical protein